MKEETQNNEPKEQKQPVKRKISFGRWMVRLLTYATVTVAVVLTVFYFLFDYTVKLAIEKDFNHKSDGNYELSIDRIETNFFKQSVNVYGFKIKPAGQIADSLYRIKEEKKAIAIDLNHGFVKIKDVKRFIFNDSLSIASFRFDTLQLSVWNYTSDTLKKDPRLQIQEALKKITPELMMDSFAIVHSSVNYYSRKNDDFFSHHIPDISIMLKEVRINNEVNQDDLLFTPVYNVEVNGYKFQKGIHSLYVGGVQAIGEPKRIFIKDLDYQKEDKASISLPYVSIIEPQVTRYIYQHEIVLDSLLFVKPSVYLKGISHASSTSTSVKENLVKLIEGFTSKISSKYVGIENADLEIERLGEYGEGSKKFQVENLTLQVDHTDIEQKTLHDKSKVIFSDNILMSFDAFDFINEKNNSVLSVGAFSGEIKDENQTLHNIEFDVPNKMNVNIHSVQIDQMDWSKLWDKQEIDLYAFRVNYPKITLRTHKKKATQHQMVNQVPSLLFEHLAYKVDIEKLLVNHGQFHQTFFGSSKGIKSQQAKNINVVFQSIHFKKHTAVAQPLKKALKEIRSLSFSDYELIPVHNQYQVHAKEVTIIPSKQELDIDGIRLDVKDQIDLGVSSFKLMGLDWEKYLNDRELEIQKVLIKEPEIVADLKPKTKNRKREPQDLKKVIPEVLFDFGSSVSVDSVVLENGTMNIRSGRKEKITQQTDSLNILIRGFVVDHTPESHNKFMFSDDIKFSFKNYKLITDSSGVELTADLIDVPSSDSLISIQSIALKDHTGDSISIPEIALHSIDWDTFWVQDSLVVGQVDIEKPQFKFTTGSKKTTSIDHQAGNQKATLTQIHKILPHGLVQHIYLNKGKFELKQDTIGTHKVAKLDVHIEQFIFDSTFLKESLPIDNMSFNIEDYTFEEHNNTIGIHTDLVKGNTKNGDVLVNNLHFFTNEIDAVTPTVELNGFQLNTLYKEKRIVFNELTVSDSEVNYAKHYSFAREQIEKDSVKFLDRLFTKLNGVEANKVMLVNTDLSAILPNSRHKLDSLNAVFEHISITPPNLNCPDRILCAKQVQVDLKNYSYVNEKKLQQISFDEFEVSSMDSLLHIKNFSFSPTIEENEFLDHLRHRKTFFSMTSEEIKSNTFDFYQLYNSHKVLAKNLVIESPELMIAENLKKARKEGKIPAMPNTLVRQMPFYMNINELEVHKADIVYNERAKQGAGTGTVYFTDTDAIIENITNDTTLMTRSNPAIIRAHTQFMNQGSLSMMMTMPLLEDTFSCEYQGVLGAMDAEVINEMIIPNANLGLKKGEVRRISFNAAIDNGVAKGEMLAKYRSFKVEIYSRNKKRKTILGTFFSNILISTNNKKRKGEIYYESTPVDSFMKIIWGGIRSGLKDTLLPGFVVNKV